jgi:hypothetical protein
MPQLTELSSMQSLSRSGDCKRRLQRKGQGGEEREQQEERGERERVHECMKQ